MVSCGKPDSASRLKQNDSGASGPFEGSENSLEVVSRSKKQSTLHGFTSTSVCDRSALVQRNEGAVASPCTQQVAVAGPSAEAAPPQKRSRGLNVRERLKLLGYSYFRVVKEATKCSITGKTVLALRSGNRIRCETLFLVL